MTFIPGDVVRLKSGGHDMTVCGNKDDRVICDWHAANGDGWQAYYVAAQLVIVEAAPIGDNVQSLVDLGVLGRKHNEAQ